MPGHLVLVGLMGAGKSTVGRRCAERLGRPFVDTDEEVERVAGRPVSAVFADEGESGFRIREREAVAAVADDLAGKAVDTIVKEGSDPIASEFRRVMVETRLGVSVEEALDGVAERFGSKDFEWVVMAIRIQRQVGGNLAELLDTVAAKIGRAHV